MSAITTSANAIVEVNKALSAILQQYLNPKTSGSIDIRFDLPDVNSTQSTPTVSVFLYDVHEDLQLRQSDPRRLNVSNGSLRPGWVHLNCNYLITYWETQRAGSDGNGPDSGPENPAVQVMTRTLQALLNNRELRGIAGAYTRIIPPQENLNSLGNFWQSLGNRPRLSLMYSVTVPILLDNSLSQPLVKTVHSDITQTANVELQALNQLLMQTLHEQMGNPAEQALAKVALKILTVPATEEKAFAVTLNLTVSGQVNACYRESLEGILDTWKGSTEKVAEINGTDVYISAVERSGILFVHHGDG
ncbi:DUF4255 domain-containing protein [Enterobacteriaceae bacterium LUAb1]